MSGSDDNDEVDDPQSLCHVLFYEEDNVNRYILINIITANLGT